VDDVSPLFPTSKCCDCPLIFACLASDPDEQVLRPRLAAVLTRSSASRFRVSPSIPASGCCDPSSRPLRHFARGQVSPSIPASGCVATSLTEIANRLIVWVSRRRSRRAGVATSRLVRLAPSTWSTGESRRRSRRAGVATPSAVAASVATHRAQLAFHHCQGLASDPDEQVLRRAGAPTASSRFRLASDPDEQVLRPLHSWSNAHFTLMSRQRSRRASVATPWRWGHSASRLESRQRSRRASVATG
jgi:hypothetical protein